MGHVTELGGTSLPSLGRDFLSLEDVEKVKLKLNITIRPEQITDLDEGFGIDEFPIFENKCIAGNTGRSQILHVKHRVEDPEHP